jgi:hypothetical protein
MSAEDDKAEDDRDVDQHFLHAHMMADEARFLYDST